MHRENQIEPYIETFTGRRMYFLEPRPEMVCIEDIAHALSNMCRFSGHTTRFYSVAEHSVHVSYLTNNLEGLLHDASEAYLVDIPKPIKPHLANYTLVEDGLMRVIADIFGFSWPVSADTKDADTFMLKAEAMQLMATGGRDWVDNFPTERVAPMSVCVKGRPPAEAETLFLRRFLELTQ